MKIVLAHNYYGSEAPSGENVCFEAERDLLERAGHVVRTFTTSSDGIRSRGAIGALQGAAATIWNPFNVARLRSLLEAERPDVLHVHNTFPLLSPAIFRAARGTATATVMTLHNYRVGCAAGLALRDGRPCTTCIERRTVRPALKHACYRGSRIATAPLAASISLHRRIGTWCRDVDAFIALTEFQRSLLGDADSLPAERIQVKPHFLADPPAPVPWRERDVELVFVGRIGEEKGVHHLLEALRDWGTDAPSLVVVGDGPYRPTLMERFAATIGSMRVRFTGQVTSTEARAVLARAKLAVIPSIAYEGFPMVIREAYALGVPVLASRVGPLPSLVRPGATGELFEGGDVRDLLAVLRAVWSDPSALERRAQGARAEFEARYTAGANLARLEEIYELALRRRRGADESKRSSISVGSGVARAGG